MADVRRLLLVTACVFVLLGAGLGFLRPVSDEGVSCGAAFRGDTSGSVSAEEIMAGESADCGQVRSDAMVLPLVLVGIGLVGALGAAVVRPQPQTAGR